MKRDAKKHLSVVPDQTPEALAQQTLTVQATMLEQERKEQKAHVQSLIDDPSFRPKLTPAELQKLVMQEKFIAHLKRKHGKIVVQPDKTIRIYNAEQGWYVPADVEEIIDEYATLRSECGYPIADDSHIRNETLGIMRVLRKRTWKPKYEKQAANYIAFQNGVVRISDLRDGRVKLLPFDKKRFCTQQVPWTFDPGMDAQVLKQAKEVLRDQLLGGDDDRFTEIALFIKCMVLRIFTSTFLLLQGPKGCGKGQLMHIIGSFVNEQLVATLMPGSRQSGGGAFVSETDRMHLRTASLLAASEVPPIWDHASFRWIKKFTTIEDWIPARNLFEKGTKFHPNFAIIFDCNENFVLPEMSDRESIERRLRILRLERSFYTARKSKDGLMTYIGKTDDHVEHWARDVYMPQYGSALLTLALMMPGIFGNSDIYCQDNSRGTTAGSIEWEIFVYLRGARSGDLIALYELTDHLKKVLDGNGRSNITPRLVSEKLREIGIDFRSGSYEKSRQRVPGKPGKDNRDVLMVATAAFDERRSAFVSRLGVKEEESPVANTIDQTALGKTSRKATTMKGIKP